MADSRMKINYQSPAFFFHSNFICINFHHFYVQKLIILHYMESNIFFSTNAYTFWYTFMVRTEKSVPSEQYVQNILFSSELTISAINFEGLIRQPKYGHLKELHRAIKMCERPLVSTDPIVTSLGESQQVLTQLQVILFFTCV